jgi:DNA invertase Pin-like site-specific DNA recombinase
VVARQRESANPAAARPRDEVGVDRGSGGCVVFGNRDLAKEIKTIRALLKTAEISVQEVATRFGVSRSTLYRNKLA